MKKESWKNKTEHGDAKQDIVRRDNTVQNKMNSTQTK